MVHATNEHKQAIQMTNSKLDTKIMTTTDKLRLNKSHITKQTPTAHICTAVIRDVNKATDCKAKAKAEAEAEASVPWHKL